MERRHKFINLIGLHGTKESILYLRACLIGCDEEVLNKFREEGVTNLLVRQAARHSYYEDLKYLKMSYEKRFQGDTLICKDTWFNEEKRL